MFIRPGAWKNVVSKVRSPWRMSSSLSPMLNAIAAANIAFCTLCMRPALERRGDQVGPEQRDVGPMIVDA